MRDTATNARPFHSLTTAWIVCGLVAAFAPCSGQIDAEAPPGASGPAVAAFEQMLAQMRAAGEEGGVPAATIAAAEELWVEQQTDLIRGDAELRILALRAGQGCPPVDEVVRLVVEREQRAFERLERLRALSASAATAEVAAEPAAAADPEESSIFGLRITSEPEDLTEDPTP